MADDARTPDEEPTQAVPGESTPAPDETAPMDRVSDETAPMKRVSDETAPMERVSDETAPMKRVSDETAPMERVSDETPPERAGDETQPVAAAGDETVPIPPASDQTRPLPPVPEEAAARWEGRAGVTPRPGRAVPRAEPEWTQVDQGPDQYRAWWAPIVLGIVGLVLVGLILLGIWLALRGSNNPVAPASPTPSPPAAASPTPSPSPPPSPSPSPSVPTVLLPNLRGVPLADAEQALTSQGLTYTVRSRVDDTLPAGLVSGTQPDGNTQVPVGSQVILFVAAAPPSSAPPESPPST